MQKPSIPKGTRDFSPEEMAKRNYIFNTIREVYHLYGRTVGAQCRKIRNESL